MEILTGNGRSQQDEETSRRDICQYHSGVIRERPMANIPKADVASHDRLKTRFIMALLCWRKEKFTNPNS